MPETQVWIWVVLGGIAVIAMIMSLGNYLHDRRSPTQDEYRRAQEALQLYEEQQKSYEEHHARAIYLFDRQEALLDRIERFIKRLEEKSRAASGAEATKHSVTPPRR